MFHDKTSHTFHLTRKAEESLGFVLVAGAKVSQYGNTCTNTIASRLQKNEEMLVPVHKCIVSRFLDQHLFAHRTQTERQ